MTRSRATTIGFSAVLMWAILAFLTIASAPVPPFLLSAMCFGIGGTIGLVWTAKGAGLGLLRIVPLKAYLLGTIGLFGYHALYFTAFRLGANASTGLIAYLWPLFIVLFSGLLPGEKLRAGHILGALIALSGAALIVLTGGGGGGIVDCPCACVSVRAYMVRLFGHLSPFRRSSD
ncbi:EamA family transporter [Pseudorhodobacter sp.]|uniref:EamA family transporter n=1 Tax=Pseudorhodobacter sp. TaxID=1934400 RepID=UPI002AFE66B9|nr:EamA family transporter [Pseudorhodobacter sp.]